MTYAIQQNLIDRFGLDELIQLTDRNNANALDSTVISRALADADAQINGYLAARYTLPLETVPGILEKCACDIARYQLFENRVTDIVRERFENTIKFLQDVASGKASLGVDNNNEQPKVTGGKAQLSSTPPVFRRDASQGFI